MDQESEATERGLALQTRDQVVGQCHSLERRSQHELAGVQDERFAVRDLDQLGQVRLLVHHIDERVAVVTEDAELAVDVQVDRRRLHAGLVERLEKSGSLDTRLNDIDAASKEYQQVIASGKLNYHIDPQFAYVVYRQVGLDFANKVIDPALNDFIKEAMPQYAITEILPRREEIRQKAKDAMNANLARYHIIVDDIYLANIAFSPEYEQAVEDKQVAAQQVQTQLQVLEQKRIQAEQAVVDAEGKANAAVALATGQAEANRLLSESLSPELIQYTAITKLNDKISVILLPATGNFLIDTRGLLPTNEP